MVHRGCISVLNPSTLPVQDQEGYLLFLEKSIYPAAEEVGPLGINPFTGFSFSIWLLGVCIWKGEAHQVFHNDIV